MYKTLEKIVQHIRMINVKIQVVLVDEVIKVAILN